MIETEKLTFKRMCMTIGNLPASYVDSMSYYECLLWLCNYLQETVIPTVNNNAEAVTELQGLFEQLQSYINTYFDNLDVQEEINNKLDDMVQQGTLQAIISEYLNSIAIFGFDTVASMKSSTNLIDGSYAKTLGYYAKNDGGSGLYKIRTVTNEDVVDGGSIIAMEDNNLVAELIIDNSIINVKQFGAYGGNTHNDSSSIQTAINYCESNKLELFIPSGNYLIGTTLNVTGCPINGESSTNTILHLNNCDGLLLKQYNKQNICVIQNIAFISDNVNLEIAGITYDDYEANSNTRSRGYKLNNLYFLNLGCAIDIIDAFRNTINDVGINNCFRALFIHDQVVQCSFSNIVANNDLPSDSTSTRYGNSINNNLSIGVQVGKSGDSKRPEGIKLSQVCMTNYNIGCLEYNCLYFTANQCEFDLCEGQAVRTVAGTSITFDGCWLANKSTSTLPIVQFDVSDFAKTNPKNLINCTILNSSTQDNVVGVYIGKNTQYGYNYNIINCNIWNGSGCELAYGVYFNRCKNCIIEKNSINGCTKDIRLINDGNGNRLINNVTSTIDVTVFADQKLYAFGNVYTTKTLANSGTIVGNFD